MYVENPTAWGTKRICRECEAKYYDMLRSPVVCPKCQTEFVEPPKRKSSSAQVKVASGPRSRATPFGHGATAWPRAAGSHSPFADTRTPTDETVAAKVTDDEEAEEVEKDADTAKEEAEEEQSQ